MRFNARLPFCLVTALVLGGVQAAHAATQTYTINANGANEVTAAGVRNQGDLDATAIGTISFDNGTGVGTTGSAVINLTLTNLDVSNLLFHHIHNGPATTNGPVVIDFGDPDPIRTGNVISGTITGLSATTITNIFGDPTNFYYNLHNGTFPGGAVRTQLPEPTTVAAMLAFGVTAMRRRR